MPGCSFTYYSFVLKQCQRAFIQNQDATTGYLWEGAGDGIKSFINYVNYSAI